MSRLTNVDTIVVPEKCVEKAHAHLQQIGQSEMEGFALWVGHLNDSRFFVKETIIPDQQAIRTPEGLCVTVGSKELHRINVWLYEHDMTLIAQLHSHPTNAYHSDTDDAFPIATAAGSLSLVLPDFAQDKFSVRHCAVYRLLPPDGWVRLTETEANRLLRLN